MDPMGKGEVWTNRESTIEIYTPPCAKQIASGKLLYGAESSGRCSVMVWRDGVGSEKEVKEGEEIHVPVADSC